MDLAIKQNVVRRINFRVILFAAVVLLVLGWPLYTLVHETLTQGIEDLGNGVVKVDLKSSGNFLFDQINGTTADVPARFRALDGKRVQFDGQMYNTDEASDRITHFQLVYSIVRCCFNGPPLVQERVFATMPPRTTVPYYTGLVRVVGVLHVKIEKDEGGNTGSVYRMDVQKVEPLG